MATNMYVKFEQPTIGGSGEIEVLSWSHGFAQPPNPARRSGEPRPVEQAIHQNLTLTKYLDGATSEILNACWTAKQFGKVTLSCYRNDSPTDTKPVLYLRVVMQHVIISDYKVSGGPGDIPVENVSLEYGVVQYEYIPLKSASEPTIAPVVQSLANRMVE